MRESWRSKTLGDVARFINGRAYKQSELLDSGPYPVLRVGNFFTNRNWYYSDLELDADKYCDDGDLLYAWSASFGPRIWNGGKVIFHYHIWKVEPDPSLLNKHYLFYFLEWDKELIQEQQGAGTTMVHVTKGAIEKRRINLPSLAEQSRIVTILDSACAGLATAAANVERNLKNAREIFDSYVNSVFAEKQEGWTTQKLGDLSQISYGYTESASSERIGPKFLRITDIQNNYVDWNTVPYCSIGKTKLEKFRLANGDIVFARTGATTGKSYIVSNPPEAVFASYLIRVRPATNVLASSFLNLFFQTQAYWDEIKMGVSGSAQGGFNATKLANLVIAFPRSLNEQKDIVLRLNSLNESCQRLDASYKQKLTALTELKQSILQRAFSGKLTSPPSSAVKEAAE